MPGEVFYYFSFGTSDMNREQYLDLMADMFIASLYIKATGENIRPVGLEIFPDHTMHRQRRHGIYGWFKDANGTVYGSSIDWEIDRARFDNPADLHGFAKIVEYRAKKVFDKEETPRFTTSEEVQETLKTLGVEL
jgi:hypothetical protein